ncbi:MAG: response regulator, partial [Thiomargarita sp.]|nr:response regulator [Thiomargarita sp.]
MKQASQILIVDDNPQNLQMLGTTLRVNGYTPLFAKNGLQVFQMLKIKRPDLILLDIMMPDMNGFEVCEKLKLDTHTKDIPVIFLSAQFETDKIIEGFKLGAVDYVTKPFNTAELLSRVNTHLKLRTTEEQLKQALFNKDKFFSIIAHDLGNLFNGLIGLSEILVEHEPTQEETDKFLPMILQTSKKGHDLLFNLLEWSRVQTGQLKPVSQKIDLISLINLNLQFLHH